MMRNNNGEEKQQQAPIWCKNESKWQKKTQKKMVPKNEFMPLYKAILRHIRFEATTSNLQTWILKKKPEYLIWYSDLGKEFILCPNFILCDIWIEIRILHVWIS